jgi:hypothetical protein
VNPYHSGFYVKLPSTWSDRCLLACGTVMMQVKALKWPEAVAVDKVLVILIY